VTPSLYHLLQRRIDSLVIPAMYVQDRIKLVSKSGAAVMIANVPDWHLSESNYGETDGKDEDRAVSLNYTLQ